MNPNPFPTANRHEPLDILTARRCAEFQSRFANGECPSLDGFLSDVPVDWKDALFEALLNVELEHRAKSGATIHENEFRRKYRDYGSVLDRVFHEQASLDWGDSNSRSLNSTVNWDWPAKVSSDFAGYHANFMVGRYRLESLLGRGGFGEVWKAIDLELDRCVAIKLGRPDRTIPGDLLRLEARKSALMKHPGIVPVYDFGTTQTGPYIVSELIQGETLTDRIKRGPLCSTEAVAIAIQIADALHHAHLQGLVHRDVKPGNILLRESGEEAVLTDFGIAVSESDQLGESNSTVGTWWYMSPEQARGESNRVDARSDIFSLGVVIYQMLTGRLPYVAEKRAAYIDQLSHRPPRPLRTIDDSIDAELEQICLKCLSKDVAERYTTAADLARALRAWQHDQSATPTAAAGSETKPSGSLRWRKTSVIVACGLIGILAVGSYFRPGPKKILPVPERPVDSAFAAFSPLGTKPSEPHRADGVGDWLPLLRSEPKMFAYSVGGIRERPRFDAVHEMYAVRGDRVRWIAQVGEMTQSSFELQAEISVEDWIGCCGVVWQLAVDTRLSPERAYHCFGVEYLRMSDSAPPELRLKEFSIKELGYDRRHIEHIGSIAVHPVELPTKPWVSLKCRVTPERIAVSFNDEKEWIAAESPLDAGWRPALNGTSFGITALGKETRVRGLAVHYFP